MTREEQVKMVKRMRELTGGGMMDCKKSLQKTNWNMDEAIEYMKRMPSRYSHVDYFGRK